LIQEFEIRARLFGTIERVGMGPDRERIAKYAAGILVAEVQKMIIEEVKKATTRGGTNGK